MPNSIDMLREKRAGGYGTDSPPASGAGDRTFKLSPEELQAIGAAKDGPVSCTVTGTVSPDGTFMVDTVESVGGSYSKEAAPDQPLQQIR